MHIKNRVEVYFTLKNEAASTARLLEAILEHIEVGQLKSLAADQKSRLEGAVEQMNLALTSESE